MWAVYGARHVLLFFNGYTLDFCINIYILVSHFISWLRGSGGHLIRHIMREMKSGIHFFFLPMTQKERAIVHFIDQMANASFLHVSCVCICLVPSVGRDRIWWHLWLELAGRNYHRAKKRKENHNYSNYKFHEGYIGWERKV